MPEQARGLLGPIDEDAGAHIRAMLHEQIESLKRERAARNIAASGRRS